MVSHEVNKLIHFLLEINYVRPQVLTRVRFMYNNYDSNWEFMKSQEKVMVIHITGKGTWRGKIELKEKETEGLSKYKTWDMIALTRYDSAHKKIDHRLTNKLKREKSVQT